MTDLATWLLERIAEDEAAARNAGWWSHVAAVGSLAAVGHHGPTRVLAECEAKRRIITEAVPDIEQLQTLADGEWGPAGEDEPDRLLRLLALPYADHDGYRQEWAPDA